MITLLSLIAFADLQQDANKEEKLFGLRAGVKLTYKNIRHPDKITTVCVVKEEKGGLDIRISWLSKEHGALASVTALVREQDGYVVTEQAGLKPTPFFKVGSKKGDRWQGGFLAQKATIEHLGMKDVSVPAGTYRGCIRLRLFLDQGKIVDVYLAPKVGVVKMATGALARATENSFPIFLESEVLTEIDTSGVLREKK